MRPIVTPLEWEAAREQLLAKEKAMTRARDALAAERRGTLAAAAFPGVKPEMMVIAAGRNERGSRPCRRHLKTEHAAVELQRAVKVGDLQVHVPDAHTRIDGRHLRGWLAHRIGHGCISRRPGWLAGTRSDTHM